MYFKKGFVYEKNNAKTDAFNGSFYGFRMWC